jgi:hypothetical protein
MATTEERLSTLDARFETFMETLVNQLSTINERISGSERSLTERLNHLRIWLIALTGLAGAQLMATVALAIAMTRLGR